jgi:16S rRNA (cytosine1402-N4)-methyltransferase
LRHKPVLLKEVLQGLNLKPRSVVVDGTLGSAGHSLEILKQLGPEGRLIALDQDPESLARCEGLFENDRRVTLVNENFLNLDKVLDSLNVPAVDAVLLDIGFSSDQIEDAKRGFSFEREGPLDMRMNPNAPISAKDVINTWPEKDLEKIFREYGEEHQARRFAYAIEQARSTQPIETTTDLIHVLEGGTPHPKKGNRPVWARRHPATKVFQALRIAVNDELGVLREGLPRIWKRVKPEGRLSVITFHSLEDRIVKYQFREWAQSGEGKLVNKKAIKSTYEERTENRRSRSAILRTIERQP